MQKPGTLLPRKLRTLRAPAFQMTARDTAIIEAIHRYRMLERRQIEKLFSPDSPHSTRIPKRLRLLYQHGYLDRVLRPIYPEEGDRGPVYRLGVEGARLLAERTGTPLSEFRYWGRGDDKDARKTHVTPLFLEHGLALAELRIAIERAALVCGCAIELWRDEIRLKHAYAKEPVRVIITANGRKERIPITPDGYFVLATSKGRGHFFLELDRSTETISKTWRRKIVGYKEYVRSGRFHERYGGSKTLTPLRILTLTLSLKHAENLKAAAERYGPPEFSPLFLFAPLEALASQDPLSSPIWLRAGSKQHQAIL